jgi:hypothetical protein
MQSLSLGQRARIILTPPPVRYHGHLIAAGALVLLAACGAPAAWSLLQTRDGGHTWRRLLPALPPTGPAPALPQTGGGGFAFPAHL